MDPVWFLLLLPSVLRAQVASDFPSGVTVETTNSTESLTNNTRTSENSTSPSTSSTAAEPSGFSTSEAPTEIEDDWSPAETFLYTGDPSTLVVGRCSRAYSTRGQMGPLPLSFTAPLRPAMDALANTANFLNMIFQASDLHESTVQEDMEWYHALVRALLEADVLIRRALFTFDADPTAQVPQLVLHATRSPMAKVQTIILQDLSKAWESLHPPAPAPDDSWFRKLKFPESSQPITTLSKRVLLNDLNTLDTPKWGQGDSYVTNRSGVRWDSAPFLDCMDERFVPGWMLTLSTSFFGLKPDLTPEFRGVIRVDVNIQDIDLDQCATGEGWFADTHQCNRTTMEATPGLECRCPAGFRSHPGAPVNESDSNGMCYPNMPICLPCWPGCKSCQDGTPCWVQEDWLLRSGVLAIQGVFMLLIFISMLVAYRHRRNRRIRASGLLLLETILFGSLLLYFPVFIMYFRPSTFRCILLRWVRMLGFSIVYGTVTLKMYRVLKVFLSRTAQRMPYMSSLHLLRILGVMLMTVSWFLCAWTVGVMQNRDRNIPVFITTNTPDGQGFNMCYLDRWDYMMAVAELLFLCWGSSLWTAVRPVPSAFHEPRYMGIAIHNELLLSSLFHLFRFTFPSLHPDWMLLLSFTHTHVTITVTLALLFVPKFLYVSKPGREEIAAEVYEDEVDLRRSGSYLNSSFHSAWSEHSVDPDDFRDELKKLYAQLEVHKTKKMAANNPHLPKKRSSRCALGRSLIKRIAEIPETMSRQCSREEKDGSFRSRSGNHSDSFRRSTETVSISYRSSMKSASLSPSPSMRKSQSDHHYVRERESLHTSTLRANTVKRSSQRSETDSLDIPPGVCKSASAQNLTIDTNLLHPDHNRLHKSWSLTSTTSHSMENIPKVNRANTVRSRPSLSISDQTRSALKSESFDKAEICPWEVEPEQSSDKNQKHVTYANSGDDEEKRPPSPIALICPWDHLPPVEKKSSVDKGLQGETESPKSTIIKENVCPWETEQPEVLKKQDSTQTDVCPWETEEPNILQIQDSALANVCPWETEEPKVLKKQDSTRTDVCPWETEEPNILQKQDSTRTDVCPWETEEPNILQKQDSALANVCPWETDETVQKKSITGAGEDKNDIPNSDKDVIESQSCLSVEGTPADTSPEQTDESKANLALGRRDALCPWEMLRSTSGSFTDNASDIFTWEPENIPEEDEEDDAECAAEALVFPPDL
uniref:Si:ch211-156l18.8 n=1 Tax=Pundamilia nyererei TaxID=303518 RepID=A0A3B4H5T6_9CICH